MGLFSRPFLHWVIFILYIYSVRAFFGEFGTEVVENIFYCMSTNTFLSQQPFQNRLLCLPLSPGTLVKNGQRAKQAKKTVVVVMIRQ